MKPVSLDEAARAIPYLERCPVHHHIVMLPCYGMRPCCVIAALQAIADAPEGRGRNIARTALRSEHRIPRLRTS